MGEGYFYCDFGGIKVPKAIKNRLYRKIETRCMKRETLKFQRFILKLNKTTDKDIIERLKGVDSKMGYIKDLIRADINRS